MVDNSQYHKIQTVFLRDPETNMKTLIDGAWSYEEFGYLADSEWVFTEKVDGTNIRVWFNEDGAHYGGKTEGALIHNGLVAHLRGVFDAFPESMLGLCLYGEGHGAKIQKGGGNYCQDQRFVCFDIRAYDEGAGNHVWLRRESVEDICDMLGIPVVPIIGRGTLREAIEMTRSGFNSQWGDFTAEGIVARPSVELLTRRGHRVITKIKHKDFRRM